MNITSCLCEVERATANVTKENIDAGKRLKPLGWAGSGVDSISVKNA